MRHGEAMRYLPTTTAQRAEMLRTIGVGDIENLIQRIPPKARLGRDLMVPAALAEDDTLGPDPGGAAPEPPVADAGARSLSRVGVRRGEASALRAAIA